MKSEFTTQKRFRHSISNVTEYSFLKKMSILNIFLFMKDIKLETT